MFGHQDDQSTPEATAAIPNESINGAAAKETDDSGQTDKTAPATPGSAVQPDPVDVPSGSPVDPAKPADPGAAPTPADDKDDPDWQHPGSPVTGDKDHDPISDIISPAGGFPKRPSYQYLAGAASPVANLGEADHDDSAIHELIDIKRQALVELAPIIDQLDLPPEEKFRTIMMIIQAIDDQTLVKAAYAAAHSIEDEKTRAQALLDIVNEVNYFTNPSEDDEIKPE